MPACNMLGAVTPTADSIRCPALWLNGGAGGVEGMGGKGVEGTEAEGIGGALRA